MPPTTTLDPMGRQSGNRREARPGIGSSPGELRFPKYVVAECNGATGKAGRGRTVADCMTPRPTVLDSSLTLVDAASTMREQSIGAVMVSSASRVMGVVTDRDIVVRGLADECDPSTTRLADLCTTELVTVSSAASVEDAAHLMREHALRRLLVVDGDLLIGIVSLGDLAAEHDAGWVLADISAAPPTD